MADKVRYIDYAGESLTDVGDGGASQDFMDTLREADALLGLLDGRRVLEMMRGESDFLEQMSRTFSLMQNSTGPIPRTVLGTGG